MFKACGHFLIVELTEAESERKSSGGILLDATIDGKRKNQLGMSTAKVVDVGPNCWTGFTDPDGNWQSWCKPDDKIMIAQYAGQSFPVSDDLPMPEQDKLKRLRLIKDDDVLARVSK